jgi:hypothetical protein
MINTIRRFTFRYDIENYNGDELKDIFLLKLAKDCWDIAPALEPR